MTNPNGFDRFLARKLASRTRLVSRRMFLSKLTRNVFAVAGVAIAAKAGLFEIGRLQAGSASQNLSAPPANVMAGPNPNPVPWEWCGLHGYVCSNTCNGGGVVTYTSAGYGWVQCCQNPADSKWHCCKYQDECSLTDPQNPNPPDLRKGCQGIYPCGPMWCAMPPSGSNYYYVCTNVSCGQVGYSSDSNCVCNPITNKGDDCHVELQGSGSYPHPGQPCPSPS